MPLPLCLYVQRSPAVLCAMHSIQAPVANSRCCSNDNTISCEESPCHHAGGRWPFGSSTPSSGSWESPRMPHGLHPTPLYLCISHHAYRRWEAFTSYAVYNGVLVRHHLG